MGTIAHPGWRGKDRRLDNSVQTEFRLIEKFKFKAFADKNQVGALESALPASRTFSGTGLRFQIKPSFERIHRP
jgi:hypothetical protein